MPHHHTSATHMHHQPTAALTDDAARLCFVVPHHTCGGGCSSTAACCRAAIAASSCAWQGAHWPLHRHQQQRTTTAFQMGNGRIQPTAARADSRVRRRAAFGYGRVSVEALSALESGHPGPTTAADSSFPDITKARSVWHGPSCVRVIQPRIQAKQKTHSHTKAKPPFLGLIFLGFSFLAVQGVCRWMLRLKDRLGHQKYANRLLKKLIRTRSGAPRDKGRRLLGSLLVCGPSLPRHGGHRMTIFSQIGTHKHTQKRYFWWGWVNATTLGGRGGDMWHRITPPTTTRDPLPPPHTPTNKAPNNPTPDQQDTIWHSINPPSPPFPSPRYASLGEQALDVVLHELGQVPEEFGGVGAVDVAVVARDGHRHLLLHLERAVLLLLGGKGMAWMSGCGWLLGGRQTPSCTAQHDLPARRRWGWRSRWRGWSPGPGAGWRRRPRRRTCRGSRW